MTRSILTLNKNHEETQERYMGRKREGREGRRRGREGRGGGEGGKGRQRKLEKGNVQGLLAHSVNFSAADDKALFPCAWT